MPVTTLISEDYLRLEDESEERHEYVDGLLRLMAGTTEEHNFVVQNFVLRLTPMSRKKQCRLVTENVRVRLPFGSKRRYYYPDVVVTCAPRGSDSRTLENPCFVAEVLSSSAEKVDRVEKLETYQRIVSLQQYILVDQAKLKVEIYSRDEKGWRYELLEEGNFNVSSLDVVITLNDVYAGLGI